MIDDPAKPDTPDADDFVREWAGAEPAKALALLTDRYRQQERIMRHLATAMKTILTFPNSDDAKEHGIKILITFDL